MDECRMCDQLALMTLDIRQTADGEPSDVAPPMRLCADCAMGFNAMMMMWVTGAFRPVMIDDSTAEALERMLAREEWPQI